MKKKIFAFSMVLCIGIGIFLFLNTKQSTSVSNTLSERSKEYLKNRSNNPDTSLNNVAVTEGGTITPSETTFTVGDCFSITVPFRVDNERNQGLCGKRIAITKPQGSIVVYQERGEVASIDEVPGVSMRRLYKDTYEEEAKVINNKTFFLFKNLESGTYEKNVFLHMSDRYFILNLSASGGPELDTKLFQMLASLEFRNK